MEIIQLMLHLLVTSQERECINLKIGYNGWVEIGGGGRTSSRKSRHTSANILIGSPLLQQTDALGWEDGI